MKTTRTTNNDRVLDQKPIRIYEIARVSSNWFYNAMRIELAKSDFIRIRLYEMFLISIRSVYTTTLYENQTVDIGDG